MSFGLKWWDEIYFGVIVSMIVFAAGVFSNQLWLVELAYLISALASIHAIVMSEKPAYLKELRRN